ncbi:MAG TPA: glycosyltransferase family 1 protein [Xanthobacteraceae bacterium]|nr:glycosyltransferase family 1 protein [Xanthobacteraceae bacterium]
MRILVATDAWLPQLNDVVRTLTSLAAALRRLGVEVGFLTPEGMRMMAVPGAPDIRIAVPSRRQIATRIADFAPDAIHIATEGPVGLAVRRYCRRRRKPFTTSFHTRPAEYASARWSIPESLAWGFLRWFHNAGRGIMASSASLGDELGRRGFNDVLRWPPGVDAHLFRPQPDASLGLLRPIFLTVGRVAANRNIAAFLALDLRGTKVVVGQGPARDDLARRYPKTIFLGGNDGEELARIYAAADVFVFPSRTDTSGLVLLESLACATPIAGFPVAATRDVIGNAPVAVLHEDLRTACLKALEISRDACRAFAQTMTWDDSARCFLDNIQRAGVVTSARPILDAIKAAARAERKTAAPAIG